MLRYIFATLLFALCLIAPANAANNLATNPAPNPAMRSVPETITAGTRVVANVDLGCEVYAGTLGTYWGTNGYEPPAYVVWDSGGGCAVAMPDGVPFDSNSDQHAHAYWVNWADLDSVATIPVSSTQPTLSYDLSSLYIPVLNYNTPFGVMTLWVQMQYVPTVDGYLWFVVTDYGFIPS